MVKSEIFASISWVAKSNNNFVTFFNIIQTSLRFCWLFSVKV